MSEFLSFVRKEFYHIIRDPRTMLILLAMPIIQIILFGFAISTEVQNARFVVLDPARDMATEQLINRMDASTYFTLVQLVETPEQIDQLFRQGRIDLALVLNHNYGKEPRIQIITDASDPNTATILTAYATAIAQESGLSGLSGLQSAPLSITTTLLYNPSMLSSYNFVPGVMGMILMLICAMMTSISIVREKEIGTMEVLLVSPVRPIFIILAKLVPYFALSVVNLTVILLLSVFVLGVPIAGSLAWLLLLSLLFIFVALSLGLFISTIVQTQLAAMMISGVVLMMPTVLLSGMMFPIENMPLPLKVVSSVLPARWFIAGVRKLMIQGVGPEAALTEFAVLTLMAIVLITISLKKFKVRL